ncbi:MAG TPA: GtrA family protein [Trebonia sp.]|jgi:putative flippase GtrA|nr:GtrA family protein [Trebonia sp.]
MSRRSPEVLFATATAAIARHLPFGLPEVVPPNVVGYLIINGCTFGIDLGLLSVFHGALGLWLPLSITMSYAIASLISYTCNRILNFQSHGEVGTQLPLYLGVLTVNYLAFILGLQEGLHALGVEYLIARILAACCEGVFLYCCMRWLVFRDAMGSTPVGPEHAAEAPAAEGGMAEAGPAEAAPAEAAPGEAGLTGPPPESPHPAVPARPEAG